MTVTELRDKIAAQAFALEKAKKRGMMVSQETERMKNVLMNNMDAIIDALTFAAEADKKVTLLATEVDDADAELREKDDEIAALKAELEKKQAPKAKPKEKTPDVE